MIDSIVNATKGFDVSLRPGVVITPLVRRPEFDLPDLELWAKLENLQVTGSFKMRGATAKLSTLDDRAVARGILAASTGNHGLAVATAAGTRGVTAEIFVSDTADPGKLSRIREAGAKLTVVTGDPVRAEEAARQAASATGATYVSPYNDPNVVSGQGTIASELLRQLPEFDGVVVAVGGGGLISGIAANLKSHDPSIRVVAASATNSAAMHHSVAAGRVVNVDHEPTLSDGTAGGIEASTVTFDLCSRLVDDWLLVDEERIAAAMKRYHAANDDWIEGSAGMALAALEQVARSGRWVAIMCGGGPRRRDESR